MLGGLCLVSSVLCMSHLWRDPVHTTTHSPAVKWLEHRRHLHTPVEHGSSISELVVFIGLGHPRLSRLHCFRASGGHVGEKFA